MNKADDDSITRTVEIDAPVARVWRALTDHEEFGSWFRARLDAPFAVGETSRGQMTYPGWEHAAWEAKVVAIEPERRFAFLLAAYRGRRTLAARRSFHPRRIHPRADGARHAADGDRERLRGPAGSPAGQRHPRQRRGLVDPDREYPRPCRRQPLRAAAVFAALGDPTRLALVATLADGRARSLGELAGGAPISRQAVSKHLRVLADAGVVGSVRQGRETHFALAPERLAAARAYLDAVGGQWEAVLGRLKAHLER